MKNQVRSVWARAIVYIVLVVFAVFYLFPFYSAINTSLKPSAELIYGPVRLVSNPTIQPFAEAWRRVRRPLFNSFVITLMATAFSTIIGSLSGFGFSKLRFKGDNVVFLIIIIGFYIAPQSILVPLLRFMGSAGLYDTYLGLALTHTAYGVPITTLLFRNYFITIPNSLFESAWMDGCSELKSYLFIALPLSLPAFAVAGIFQFTNIFNEYLFGLVLTRGIESQPVTVSIANLAGTTVAAHNVQMAGVLISIFPVLLIYVFMLKLVVRGLLAGSIKG